MCVNGAPHILLAVIGKEKIEEVTIEVHATRSGPGPRAILSGAVGA
jgi:hypothetical protein